MINQLFNQCWALYPNSLPAVLDAIKRAIAGPVDDAQRYGLAIKKHGATAIVEMKGAMIKDAGYLTRYGFAGTRDTANALKSAAMDDDIEQTLWVVDSPGGSVDGLGELATTAAEVAAIKPLIVQVDGLMASAAVYATANATKIYSGRRDLIGSIGTRMMLYDYSELFKNEGIKAIAIDTGEHKSAGALGTEITEAQQAEFQRIADGYFSDFLSVVETGRGIDPNTLRSLADGRVFFADEEPLTNNLIDGIRTMDEAMASFKKPTTNGRTARARLSLLSI